MESSEDAVLGRKVNKPDDSGINFKTAKKVVKKEKGLKPLLNKEQSIEAVDNVFAMLATGVDSRWKLEPEESKELGERVANCLALFPVKAESDSEALQKIFAIIAVLAGFIFICKTRAIETFTEENDGIIGRLLKKENS